MYTSSAQCAIRVCFAEFEMKRKRAIKYDEMKSGKGYIPGAFSPKDSFAELVQSVEEAFDGVLLYRLIWICIVQKTQRATSTNRGMQRANQCIRGASHDDLQQR